MTRLFCNLLLFFLCLAATPVSAEEYPTKPVRFVVGFGPGGSTDLQARIIAEKLGQRRSWRVVVENRPGATGLIASDIVAKSPPDGYTLLVTPDSLLTSVPHLHAKLSHDPWSDLSPVVQIARYQGVIVGGPSLSAKTIPELVAFGKAHPGLLNLGSLGVGSFFHLCGERFSTMADIRMVHVPYQGFGQASLAIAGGQIDLFVNTVGGLLPLIEGGKVRALAVTGTLRHPLLPGVPTIGESVPGYEMSTGTGIFSPRGTPVSVIEQLNGAIVSVLSDSETLAVWQKKGDGFVPNSPAEFAAYLKKESKRHGALIKQLGIKVE